MMEVLEKDIAKEIINIGLGKAADSMAFFTKEKVIIRGLDVQEVDIREIDKVTSGLSNELQYILSTELKGDLKGICYLVFSEQEVGKLLEVILPESTRNDADKMRIMGEAILLEMDNIIVASVITQFSNFFNYSMYGDVPKLNKSYSHDLKKMIIDENSDKGYLLYFKSEMHTNGMDICPEFIWIMDDKYYQGVRDIAKNDKVLKKLNLT